MHPCVDQKEVTPPQEETQDLATFMDKETCSQILQASLMNLKLEEEDKQEQACQECQPQVVSPTLFTEWHREEETMTVTADYYIETPATSQPHSLQQGMVPEMKTVYKE